MAVGPVQAAKRAFVRVLLALAVVYNVSLVITRDSPDADVVKAYKKVSLKAHPDKGGRAEDQKALHEAKQAWDKAVGEAAKPGRPQRASGSTGSDQGPGGHDTNTSESRDTTPTEWVELADPAEARREYRIQSVGVLLTYNGVTDLAQWRRFVAFVRSRLKQWRVKHWCATLEANKKGKLHIHMMMQFHGQQVDRSSRGFAFENLTPGADPTDILGVGFNRRRMQESIDRGMYYCWADKRGTQKDEHGVVCTVGNYEPCWTDAALAYTVLSGWPKSLWRAHKLDHAVYERHILQCRDGYAAQKRNLDAVLAEEERQEVNARIEERKKRIRGNPEIYSEWPEVPAAQAWLKVFEKDAVRYPFLLVRGPSHTGKTEWAKSLFKNPLECKVGPLIHFFPEKMRTFNSKQHDAIILDDVRDLEFLRYHQEKLQGKYDYAVEFASTPGGKCSYEKDLFCIPIVATVNFSTANLSYLETDDFLKLPKNRVVLDFPPQSPGS